MTCQKEPPQTPKRKSPGGAWRQTERRRGRMALRIAGRALALACGKLKGCTRAERALPPDAVR